MIKVAYDPIYVHPVPENHRFPMEKYELIMEQLLHEGIIEPHQLHQPYPLEEDIILLTHTKAYWEDLKHLQISPKEQRATGFVHNKALIERERIITRGTVDMALHALEDGAGLNIAGGTHHSYIDRGEGFCLLNDFAVSANYLLHKKLIHHALIIDLDVHQGNGSAKIFEQNDRVFTFSMHGKDNYPLRKEKSDLDIHLPTGTKDKEYLEILDRELTGLLTQKTPDIIFYQSGVDVLATDKLGHLSLSPEACKQRDLMVLTRAKDLGIPVCIAMGGGYSPDIKVILEAHINTFRIAADLFA